jgi:hypothetical protein
MSLLINEEKLLKCKFHFKVFYLTRLSISKIIKYSETWEYGAMVEWYWQGKTDVLVEKSVRLPLCALQVL